MQILAYSPYNPHSPFGYNPITPAKLLHVYPFSWGDLAPMTAPVPFGMNSSSSQLLDMLHALRLGQFFFPSFTSRLPIKINKLIAQAFQTPTTYFHLTKTLNLVAIQEQKRCCRRRCYKSDVEVLLEKKMLQRWCWSNVAEVMLKRWCKRRCWSGVAKNVFVT